MLGRLPSDVGGLTAHGMHSPFVTSLALSTARLNLLIDRHTKAMRDGRSPAVCHICELVPTGLSLPGHPCALIPGTSFYEGFPMSASLERRRLYTPSPYGFERFLHASLGLYLEPAASGGRLRGRAAGRLAQATRIGLTIGQGAR